MGKPRKRKVTKQNKNNYYDFEEIKTIYNENKKDDSSINFCYILLILGSILMILSIYGIYVSSIYQDKKITEMKKYTSLTKYDFDHAKEISEKYNILEGDLIELNPKPIWYYYAKGKHFEVKSKNSVIVKELKTDIFGSVRMSLFDSSVGVEGLNVVRCQNKGQEDEYCKADSSKILFEYIETMLMVYTSLPLRDVPYCDEDVNILIIGLGAGTIPAFIQSYIPNAKMTIVEINKQVIDFVEDLGFHYKDDNNIEMIEMDAAEYVNSLKCDGNKFDYIFLDAYTFEDTLVYELTTPTAINNFNDHCFKYPTHQFDNDNYNKENTKSSYLIVNCAFKQHLTYIKDLTKTFPHSYSIESCQANDIIVSQTNPNFKISRTDLIERNEIINSLSSSSSSSCYNAPVLTRGRGYYKYINTSNNYYESKYNTIQHRYKSYICDDIFVPCFHKK
eukprot:TRINITY_DN3268_c0_g1_i1.p1 TRINITY_DN3268_c0_g1~~TRINITY_DN3268_c0_g1_i1.p1  ORF type:complete len:447 (+),score=99.37 TRINITY_DN3268_c0_g1_i1:85-1425(+)